ncbi:hypothetical protein [Rhizobium sp.]|uniref:hypothetical protein n=1 Tax=Rhizobium sp. TaxID=391 RepID=UPI0028ADB800
MPHFDLEVGEDGTVPRVLKDGDPYMAVVRLEQVYTVVSTHFSARFGSSAGDV